MYSCIRWCVSVCTQRHEKSHDYTLRIKSDGERNGLRGVRIDGSYIDPLSCGHAPRDDSLDLEVRGGRAPPGRPTRDHNITPPKLPRSTMTDREYITCREASALTGLARNTLYILARQGKCPATRIPGTKILRFPLAAFMAWIESGNLYEPKNDERSVDP